ncbi:MAG: phytanoyl-CoA dioxygenase [Crocinitomicaceae bacterium]|nr:phytanoyl-CoA dioxygenase [Crocinitomicaceae bacterium]|tara:strand:+ start:798 stop:1727 length:930 start_codon:yes stop_codon:yes gene_type:complete
MFFFRKSKFLYELYNFFNYSKLKRNIPFYRKLGLNKKYFSSISNKDFKSANSSLITPSQKEIDVINTEFQKLPQSIKEDVRFFTNDGYAIIKSFFAEDYVEAINNEIERMLESGEVSFKYQNKIMFAIHKSDLINKMGSDKKLMTILNYLQKDNTTLFQSINFLTGSNQKTHSDAIHMSTFPKGKMIAVWVALEDMNIENGPLHYYPGSHRLPYVMNEDFGNIGGRFWLGPKDYSDYEHKIQEIIEEKGLKKKVFIAAKGDVLIWHANILHGGEKVNDPELTRKSVVFHYYADNCIAFHEITERPTFRN